MAGQAGREWRDDRIVRRHAMAPRSCHWRQGASRGAIALAAFAATVLPVIATAEPAIADCAARFPGRDEAAKARRFACYDQAESLTAGTPAAPSPSVTAGSVAGSALPVPPAPVEESGSRLATLWKPTPDADGFRIYKPNALMFVHSDRPNNAPTSPNPANRVPYAGDLRSDEVKFQISAKALVPTGDWLGPQQGLWVAYTQQSHWQITDHDGSRPFRESNYEPELIFSRRIAAEDAAPWAILGLTPQFFNVGLVHQSNGQSDPRSRSWNRVYAQLGTEKVLGPKESVAVLIRPWWRLHESATQDNNHDITDYLGHGDLQVLYWRDQSFLSLLARRRAVQLDFSAPPFWLSQEQQARSALRFHLQYFTGYGESLIDYNQRHSVLGIGVSLPYGQ